MTQPAAPEEALRFGGISLPPSGRVLGVENEAGIDELYRVVVGLPAVDVPELLSDSGFTVPLTPDAGPFQDSVKGFDLAAGKSVRAGEDTHQVGGRTITRQLAVDETDPITATVHLWLFTT
ncbi:hypothetical protein Acsp05_13080 [Actinokineospora sp. NBRC 105648]|nr:hypothetical protein Acsp05_13080 [Actinokineospora sp. NBRC 105648]